MAFWIRNPETDAMARKLARLKKTTITQAVHIALSHELEEELAKLAMTEQGFVSEREARNNLEQGKPAGRE